MWPQLHLMYVKHLFTMWLVHHHHHSCHLSWKCHNVQLYSYSLSLVLRFLSVQWQEVKKKIMQMTTNKDKEEIHYYLLTRLSLFSSYLRAVTRLPRLEGANCRTNVQAWTSRSSKRWGWGPEPRTCWSKYRSERTHSAHAASAQRERMNCSETEWLHRYCVHLHGYINRSLTF